MGLSHTFSGAREKIDRWKRAGNEDATGHFKNRSAPTSREEGSSQGGERTSLMFRRAEAPMETCRRERGGADFQEVKERRARELERNSRQPGHSSR